MSGTCRRANTILVLLAMGAAHVLAAEQSAWERFLVVADAHRALGRYGIEITVRLGTGEQVLHAEVECVTAYHCERTIGPLTVLQTPEWTIAADRGRKTLTVAPRDPAPQTRMAYPDPQRMLSDWLKVGANISGGELTPTGHRWVMRPPGRRPMVEVFTDADTHLLRRISYAADAAVSRRLDVFFHWRTSGVDEARVDPMNYIRVRGKQIEAARAYQGYRVIRVQGP